MYTPWNGRIFSKFSTDEIRTSWIDRAGDFINTIFIGRRDALEIDTLTNHIVYDTSLLRILQF